MRLNEYQAQTNETAIYEDKIIYPLMGLYGEMGEVSEIIKKSKRGDYLLEERRSDLRKELGDVFWYFARLSDDLGFTLEEIARENLEKLADRKKRNVIKGDGDDR